MSNLGRKIESLRLNKNAYSESLEKICEVVKLPYYNYSIIDVENSVTELWYFGIAIFRGKMETMNYDNTVGNLLQILAIIDADRDLPTNEHEDAIFKNIIKHVHFHGKWELNGGTVIITYFRFSMTVHHDWFVANFKNQIIEFEDTLQVAFTDKKKFINNFLNAMCL